MFRRIRFRSCTLECFIRVFSVKRHFLALLWNSTKRAQQLLNFCNPVSGFYRKKRTYKAFNVSLRLSYKDDELRCTSATVREDKTITKVNWLLGQYLLRSKLVIMWKLLRKLAFLLNNDRIHSASFSGLLLILKNGNIYKTSIHQTISKHLQHSPVKLMPFW